MKKICILDSSTLGDSDLSIIRELGEVTLYETTKPDEVAQRIKGKNIILSNKVVLNQNNMKDAEDIELICVMATGTNNIDVEYAKNRGIVVTNVAGYSTDAVVQHTFALVLYLYEKLAYYDNYVKSGDYAKSAIFTNLNRPYNELKGKKWGIIGLGAIGRGVAKIAEAFGSEVIYYSTSGKNTNSEYRRVSLDELLSKADIVSIHSPLSTVTKGLINYNNVAKMKRNAILINVGRGPIVVEEDLAKALDEGLIAGAGLDVLGVEPMERENPLLRVKNKDRLLITPHIAWASIEARERLVNEVVLNIKAFEKGELRNRV